MLESDQESNWSVQFAWGNLHHMWIASRALFCLCLWKHITGASPVSVRPQGIQWKKQKGSQESDCWECKQQSQGGRVKDQSRSQSRSWSGGNRSAARRREELEAVPRRLTNGNIWRLNYPLKGKKERENPRPEFAVCTDKIQRAPSGNSSEVMMRRRLPQWLSSKESACNAGASEDWDSVHGSGRSAEGGYGNPL